MLLSIITADRLICIVFNFRVQPLTLRACHFICLGAWSLGLALSFLPMSGLSYFYDSEHGHRFYGRSTVCLALQLSDDRPPGWEYSVSIFIGLNLLAFLFISLAYLAIFLSAVKSSSSIRSTNVKRESALAKRVAFIILTDFCCWMPVIVVGILSLTGSFHDSEKQVYMWMAVFVLPVNSSVNPILYTIATPQVQGWLCKDSSAAKGKKKTHISTFLDESLLTKWLEYHSLAVMEEILSHFIWFAHFPSRLFVILNNLYMLIICHTVQGARQARFAGKTTATSNNNCTTKQLS